LTYKTSFLPLYVIDYQELKHLLNKEIYKYKKTIWRVIVRFGYFIWLDWKKSKEEKVKSPKKKTTRENEKTKKEKEKTHQGGRDGRFLGSNKAID
jgi:hypothetical protein